jgi:alpha-tubulin suppressor-like RCC1 family protein
VRGPLQRRRPVGGWPVRARHRAPSTRWLAIVAALVVMLVVAAGSGRAGARVSAAGIAAGDAHSCALTSTRGVVCWGATYGARPSAVPGLGTGVAAIAARAFDTCALTVNGGVKCWGNNLYGQLGDGRTGDASTTPVDVVGLNSGVRATSVGGSHSCAVTNARGVKCWGLNRFGQLGDGTTTDRWTPVDVAELGSGVSAIATGSYDSCALTTGGGVKCWGISVGSPTPADVPGLASGVAAIAAGTLHACALTIAGAVKCWGNNGGGQLGDGTTASRSTPVDVSGLSSGVTAIAAGDLHTCALTAAGRVRCWGLNAFGQAGEGTPAQPATPVEVPGLAGIVKAIAAGAEHSCAVMSVGGVACWGRNAFGQLGDGTTRNAARPVSVIGFGVAKATVGVVSRSVTVTPGRVAGVRLRCGSDARCAGAVTLTASVAGKLVGSSARRVELKLGTRAFSLATGDARVVQVKLTARAFALLNRVRRLSTKARITYVQPAGGKTVATRPVTLLAPR